MKESGRSRRPIKTLNDPCADFGRRGKHARSSTKRGGNLLLKGSGSCILFISGQCCRWSALLACLLGYAMLVLLSLLHPRA